MLLKVIDHKDRERYINPTYIKSLSPKGDDECEIEISGWMQALRVRQPMDDVAAVLNSVHFATHHVPTSEEAQQAAATSAATVIGMIG